MLLTAPGPITSSRPSKSFAWALSPTTDRVLLKKEVVIANSASSVLTCPLLPFWGPATLTLEMARFLEGGSTNFGSGSELQGGGAPALQCQIYVYVLSLCKYIVKSGRKKYKFEDPVQPLLHNNEQEFDNKFRSQVYLIRCNSLSGGPMPP